MSDGSGASAARICLVGATGMIGAMTIARAVGRRDLQLIAVSRREAKLPPGARAEQRLAATPHWPGLISSTGAAVLVSAIGTTRAKAGSAEAFQAIDRDLVVACAKAARAAGVERMIVVSSVGADAASRNLYLRTKGEMEQRLCALAFTRLDVLRPAQLMGPRAERRRAEQLAQVAMRGLDVFLRGRLRRFHSIASRDVADAILALASERGPGRFVHEHDAILAVARRT